MLIVRFKNKSVFLLKKKKENPVTVLSDGLWQVWIPQVKGH